MYIGHFDGASEPNPGPSGIGAVIISPDGESVWENSKSLGHKTNNEAEYLALISLLKELKNREIKECLIKGDSQLVINQVSGEWQVKKPHLFSLCAEARSLMSTGHKLKWVPREENKIADRLSKETLSSTGTAIIETSRLKPVKDDLETNANLKMEPKEVFDGIFLIRSSCREKIYAVDTENKACTCPAFVHGKTRPCKHMLGVEEFLLQKSLEEVQSKMAAIG